jgi:DNA primase
VRDIDEIKDRADLRLLIEEDLGPPASERRCRVWWSCPFHNETEASFGVIPSGDGYKCFGCGASGDVFSWLMEYRGMTFPQAKKYLAGETGVKVSVRRGHRKPKPRTSRQAPKNVWQDRARQFIESSAAEQGRVEAYLKTRGLSVQTGLGWNPKSVRDDASSWGLDGKAVWLPAGLVIPWVIDGEVWTVRIRRERGEPKYIMPRGGRGSGMYRIDTVGDRPVVLCEAEIDALTVVQEAGDLVDVVATGASTGGREKPWLLSLACVPQVLVAFDADSAGEKASEWWLEMLGNARRLRPTEHDINAMHMSGRSVRDWVVGELGDV